jgi:hypothetical protein
VALRPLEHQRGRVALDECQLGDGPVSLRRVGDAGALQVVVLVLERVIVLVCREEPVIGAELEALAGDDREGARARVVKGRHLALVEREDELLEVLGGIEEAEPMEDGFLGGDPLRRVLGPEVGLELGEEPALVDDAERDLGGRLQTADRRDLLLDLADLGFDARIDAGRTARRRRPASRGGGRAGRGRPARGRLGRRADDRARGGRRGRGRITGSARAGEEVPECGTDDDAADEQPRHERDGRAPAFGRRSRNGR